MCYIIKRPKYLYMYFTAANAYRFLQTHSLKFTKPFMCNDPFEFAIDYNKSLKTSGFTKAYLSSQSLNPKEIIDLKNDWQNKCKLVRMACFSEDSKNLLMWAYYAEAYQGLCIEFDIEKDPVFFDNDLKQVIYRTDLAAIGRKTAEGVDYSNILVSKSKHWQHEKEWRIIRHDLEVDFWPINPQAITSIILGYYTAKSDKNMGIYQNIFQLLEQPMYKHLQVKCCLPSLDKYQIQQTDLHFFILNKTTQSCTILSLQDQQCIITKEEQCIYNAPVCQWETITISLPIGTYIISNSTAPTNLLLTVSA